MRITVEAESREGRITVIGKHVYGNLYGCKANSLRDARFLERVVLEAARIGRMTVLDVKSWKIGEGVSVIAVILESHIAIHTWPEYSFATVDVYSCGEHSDPEAAFAYISKALEARDVVRGYVDRSLIGV